jgi:pimeloyl-ACP methyl ester carboxylesterase
MGSNLAPQLAADTDLAGVVVWGGGARTWAERTLAFERNRLELGATPPTARSAEMAAKYRLIDRWLIAGESPPAIAAADAQLAAAWSRFAGVSATGMYGRPFAFHQQAQRRDWASAWTRVRAPVLVLFGEFDWFEDVGGVQLIGDIVNAEAPGRARVVVFPGYDHHFAKHASRKAAFTEAGVADPAPIMQVMLPWLRERLRLG